MARMPGLRSVPGGLSVRLLILTVLFVMLSEVLIFLPSVARYRLDYLESRLDAAHLATFALEATPDNMVSQQLANDAPRPCRRARHHPAQAQQHDLDARRRECRRTSTRPTICAARAFRWKSPTRS